MPPDTSAYYHAAYVVITAIYLAYFVSLWRRSSRTMDRLRTLGQGRGSTDGA
jgi:hypothetical protein